MNEPGTVGKYELTGKVFKCQSLLFLCPLLVNELKSDLILSSTCRSNKYKRHKVAWHLNRLPISLCQFFELTAMVSMSTLKSDPAQKLPFLSTYVRTTMLSRSFCSPQVPKMASHSLRLIYGNEHYHPMVTHTYIQRHALYRSGRCAWFVSVPGRSCW